MGTPYSDIFDRFYKKLKNDKDFFSYGDLSLEEIEGLVKDHSIDLLNQAIEMIYCYGNPDCDFFDKDDTLQQFNGDLVKQEVGLIVDLMHQKYIEEGKNKLKAFSLIFNSREISMLSPANERSSFLKMLENINNENIGKINNYLSRDRLTWNFKSIY